MMQNALDYFIMNIICSHSLLRCISACHMHYKIKFSWKSYININAALCFFPNTSQLIGGSTCEISEVSGCRVIRRKVVKKFVSFIFQHIFSFMEKMRYCARHVRPSICPSFREFHLSVSRRPSVRFRRFRRRENALSLTHCSEHWSNFS
jgi:hypothetical protein